MYFWYARGSGLSTVILKQDNDVDDVCIHTATDIPSSSVCTTTTSDRGPSPALVDAATQILY